MTTLQHTFDTVSTSERSRSYLADDKDENGRKDRVGKERNCFKAVLNFRKNTDRYEKNHFTIYGCDGSRSLCRIL